MASKVALGLNAGYQKKEEWAIHADVCGGSFCEIAKKCILAVINLINVGKFHETIKPAHQEFIKKQHLFFVATAPLNAKGHVNVSPKGLDCFRVLSEHTVAYMDLISSGNETSAHMLENGRITIMFCSFEGAPNILRLYGRGFTVLPGSADWETYAQHFTIYPSTRQIIVADINLVQTSCGFGVPLFEYAGERDHHFDWAEAKGEDGLLEYQEKNNLKSLDGLPTSLAVNRNL